MDLAQLTHPKRASMAPPPEMRSWLNWSELTGGDLVTESEFLSALQQLPRSGLLISCARLSILFKFGPDAKTVASKEVTEWAVPHVFPAVLVPRALYANEHDRPIFFQGQIRKLAAECLRLDPAGEENGRIIPDMALGGLLLGAGELLNKKHIQVTEDLDIMANLIADFLPVYEIDSLNDGFILFLRFYIYLKHIIPAMPDQLVTFDVWAEFEREFGFSLKLYYLFIYSFTMHAQLEREDLKLGDVPGHGGLPISWFDTTVLTRAQVDEMFKTVCCELSDLPDKKKIHGYADCEYLRDHPYFRHGDHLYCLDYEFAGAKLESGVLWRIAKNMPKPRRLSYFGFWGEVFEAYVAWMFDIYPDKAKNAFYRAPRYENTKDKLPICDVIVMCGTTAVLIEVKLGTCAADVRYSGDYVQFRKFLEEKLVTGTDRPIGVSQLVTAIKNIRSLPRESLPVWLREADKFLSLIITKDDIGSSWMTSAYLNARFKQSLAAQDIEDERVGPLMSMSVATFERSIYSLRTTALSEILEDRIKEDPQLGRPFEAGSTYIHRGMPRGIHKHIEVLHEVTEELEKDFWVKA
jgi:hypothetical protein